MSRQLNLRVNDEFAERLERLARRLGRPMAAVLETVGTPAIELAEADLLFEAEALAAWDEYELTGIHLPEEAVNVLFATAHLRATAVAAKRGA